MKAIGAKTARDFRDDRARPQHFKPRFFLRLVAVAAERFAALDRVGDVLGHVAQLSEFRSVASAGAMRLDQPSRHQPEEVEAPLFFVGRLMEGPLLEQSSPAPDRARWRARRVGLEAQQLGPAELLASRLMALGIRFPFKRFAVKLLGLFKDYGPNLSGISRPAGEAGSRYD